MAKATEKAFNPRSALIIVKQTFKAMAEESGDEKLLASLSPSNPDSKRIHESDACHRQTLTEVCQALLELDIDAKFVKRHPGEEFEVNSDFVITIGGDGTFLDASHSIVSDVPVLGVNSAPDSSFGNFCPVNKETVKDYLTQILAGAITPTPLTRLRAQLDGQVLAPFILNEAFASHASPAGTTRYFISHAGERVMQKSSGLIVSTAPGSTGLNRSAGGKILPITADYFIFKNLAPFRVPGVDYFDNTIISNDGVLEIDSDMVGGMLFIDGQHICYEFERGSSLTIDTKAPVINAFVDKDRHKAFK